MKCNPNEAAHPVPMFNGADGCMREVDNLGLTKREHFAALAMQGLCASDGLSDDTPAGIARFATIVADALIAELNKPCA